MRRRFFNGGGLSHNIANPVDHHVGEGWISRVHLVQGNHRRHRRREQSLLVGNIRRNDIQRRLGVGLHITALSALSHRGRCHIRVKDRRSIWHFPRTPTQSDDRHFRRQRVRRWGPADRWRAWPAHRGRARRSRDDWARRVRHRSQRGLRAAPRPARRSSRCSSRCSRDSSRRSSRNC